MKASKPRLKESAKDPKLAQIIKLAVMAVGGQGGGVLTNWIEALARANGYTCQATSVAGVAQRTGATIYYIEIAPTSEQMPVFSLAPAAGDVDILVASEMMEAGRAIMRGFVTPDRTVLIASTHRALAVSEKTALGDAIASSDEVVSAAEIAAQRLILADFEAIAVQNGSVISASLFGALAASGALPFPRIAFENAIKASGKGIAPSLRAFGVAFDTAAGNPASAVAAAQPAQGMVVPAKLQDQWEALNRRLDALPDTVTDMASAGLQKTIEFQDLAYGEEYLARLETVLEYDSAEKNYLLTQQAAKYIANAMAYDDVIRVADLKTRSARFDRIRREMSVADANLMHVTEFMHPRADEVVGMLPRNMGARVRANPKWMRRLDRWFNKGRRLRTDSLRAFLILHFLGGLRGYRHRTLRHYEEVQHLNTWLSAALGYHAANYDLAVEVIRARRLIKGYSDTHARGQSKFDRVMQGIALVGHRPDAADWARRLREAAMMDEKGAALDGALATIRSFSE